MVASWLVRSFPDRAVRVWVLAGDTVLSSWARQLTLKVPLSTQEYKWVLANCWGNLSNCRGVTCDGLASRPGGVENYSSRAASCYRNQDKLWQLWASHGLKASLNSRKPVKRRSCLTRESVNSISKVGCIVRWNFLKMEHLLTQER